MVGRRGPAQAAFTELELKELGKINNVNIKIHGSLQLSDADKIEVEQSNKARKTLKSYQHLLNKIRMKTQKNNSFNVFNSPKKIITENNTVTGIEFERTKLFGDANQQKQKELEK